MERYDIKIPSEINEIETLSEHGKKITWLVWFWSRNEEGKCFATNKKMADVLRLTNRTLRRGLHNAIENGFIIREDLPTNFGNQRLLTPSTKTKRIYQRNGLGEVTDGQGGGQNCPTDNSIYNNISSSPFPSEKKPEDNDAHASASSIPYSDDVRIIRLWDYWNSLDIIKHRDSSVKTKRKAFQELYVALNNNSRDNSFTEQEIKEAFKTYKALLDYPYNKFTNSSPWKVSLPEFFQFSDYTKKKIEKGYPELEGIDSYFQLCLKGKDYVIDRFAYRSEDRNPEITKLIINICLDLFPSMPLDTYDRAKKRNIVVKCSNTLVKFYKTYRKNLIPAFGKPSLKKDLLQLLRSFIQEKCRKPYDLQMLGSPFFEDDFKEFLVDGGFLKDKSVKLKKRRMDGKGKRRVELKKRRLKKEMSRRYGA